MADKLYDRQGKKLLKSLIPYSTLFFSGIRPPHLGTSHYLSPGGGGGMDDLGLNKVKFSRSLPKLAGFEINGCQPKLRWGNQIVPISRGTNP